MEALRARGYRPNSRWGQNFLFDPKLLDAFVADAEVHEGEALLEVGPGAGTLTRRLLDLGCRVVAAEIDPILCEHLRSEFSDSIAAQQLILWQGDALAKKSTLDDGLSQTISALCPMFRLVANLPYAIATPLIHTLLQRDTREGESEMSGFGVLLQKELADRWVAASGEAEFGPTAVALSLTGSGRVTRKVGRKLFVPPPKVDSAFVLWRRERSLTDADRSVLEITRKLFSQRRKMLRSLLREVLPAETEWWERFGVALWQSGCARNRRGYRWHLRCHVRGERGNVRASER